MNDTLIPDAGLAGDDGQVDPASTPEDPTEIGALLRRLRGKRSLRRVQAETGVPYTYLSSIELGQKNPGIKTLSRLAEFYEVPVFELLKAAGLPEMRVIWTNPSTSAAGLESVLRAFEEGNVRTLSEEEIKDTNIQRSYDFVMADPDLSGCRKPEERPSVDFQRFVVEMYEHFTGKKIL